MARRKKKRSRSLETAEFRLNALQNIDENLDFGAGFSTTSYQTLVQTAQEQLNRYNAMLSDVDNQRSVVRKLEKQLDDANERVFSGIITLYGRDSIEYEMVGGTRKSNIRNRNIRPVTHDPEAFSEDPVTEEENGGI